MIESWSIAGANDEAILGNTHRPRSEPRGAILIAHGFKGYKDYGMFPRIAAECAHAEFIAHRFNFSHSGMTNEIARFERPDLFERDTWNKQVVDLRAVIEAMSRGELAGQGLPYFIFGHSRGGVTALLTAGRFANDPSFPQPSGVITAAAPSDCNSLTSEGAAELLRRGFLESLSSRTGQRLRIGREFLQEQLDDPSNHDLPGLVGRINCPILIVHGEADPTVPVACADAVASAAKHPTVVRIAGGDHVFNTPNPMPESASPSPQLNALIAAIRQFVTSVLANQA